jgi:hypothetical protein
MLAKGAENVASFITSLSKYSMHAKLKRAGRNPITKLS